MNININLSDFKKKHKNKKNQVIFHKSKCKNNKVIENLINNFLTKKNIQLLVCFLYIFEKFSKWSLQVAGSFRR